MSWCTIFVCSLWDMRHPLAMVATMVASMESKYIVHWPLPGGRWKDIIILWLWLNWWDRSLYSNHPFKYANWFCKACAYLHGSCVLKYCTYVCTLVPFVVPHWLPMTQLEDRKMWSSKGKGKWLNESQRTLIMEKLSKPNPYSSKWVLQLISENQPMTHNP